MCIRDRTYGRQGAVSLRVIQNVFGVVFALAFCVIFYWFMSKKKESEVTVHAEGSEMCIRDRFVRLLTIFI